MVRIHDPEPLPIPVSWSVRSPASQAGGRRAALLRATNYGRVAEWFKAAVLKTEAVKAAVGSNPTPSAILRSAQPDRAPGEFAKLCEPSGLGFETPPLRHQSWHHLGVAQPGQSAALGTRRSSVRIGPSRPIGAVPQEGSDHPRVALLGSSPSGFAGYSLAAKALASGARDRGFEYHYPDQIYTTGG